MAVGTLAGMHCSAGTTYVDITFTRPSNCTKIIFIMTATDGVSAPIQKSYTIPLPYAPGASITYRFTGLLSTKKYYLTGRPYNGSEAGTLRTYSNSTSSPVNCIVMPSAKTTATSTTTTTTTKSPTTASSGAGPVKPTTPTGTTINGGTVSTSSASGSNTPTPGATDAPVPSDLNSPSRLSLKIPDLAPNQTYSIKVRAFTTDSSGQTIYSEYSTPIYLTTPGFSASGANHLTANENGDILLSGGSIFAGDFGPDVGLFDVVNGTTYGTGVILNQTGLAGLNAGVKEFYIDAATGNAYFAGTIGATVIQSTNYSASTATVEPKYTVAGMQIDLNNGSISSKAFRITEAGSAYFSGDLAGSVTIDGVKTVSAVVADAQKGLTKNKTIVASTQPATADAVGDLWYDSANGYKTYRWNGTSWVSVQDTSIQTAQQAAITANNNALAAQSSASGKNRIIYGAKGTTANDGQAPNLQNYTVTSSATGGTATTDTFSDTYTNTSGNIEGDTWFVRNVNGSIIAQYTIVSGTWTRTTVSSQVIGNLDAGKITAGTISSIAYNNGNGTFQVDVYGNLIATSASITGALTVAAGTNYWGPSGMAVSTAIGNISMSATSGSGYINLAAGSPLSGIDDTASYNGSSASAYYKTSKIRLSSAGTYIYGMPVQGNYTDYQSVAGGTIAFAVTDYNAGNLSYGIGAGARQRMLIEDPYSSLVKLGMAVYYGQRTSAPSGSTGYVGDLWVSW
jgi:hypothetical protein